MSTPEPLISVMLPARHASQTLEAAARSCLAQTHENLELLLLQNDTDALTRQIMEALCREDARIRILHSPPGAGFIAALNLGWQEARGEYLARMDADDWSYPQRLEKQLAFLRANSELQACGTGVEILRRGPEGVEPPLQGYADFEAWLNSVVEPPDMVSQRFIDSPIANPSAMLRRSAMESLGGYREVDWAEDYDFWLRMLETGPVVGKVPEVLLRWYDSDSRLTRNDDHYSIREFQRARAHYLARLDLVRQRGVVICGAGPIGKKLARDLLEEGIEVRAFIDRAERRIGNEIAGVFVHAEERIPAFLDAVMIAAVGLPGARDQIRATLQPHDFTEGNDFFCAA